MKGQFLLILNKKEKMKNKITILLVVIFCLFIMACETQYELRIYNTTKETLKVTYKIKEDATFPEIESIEPYHGNILPMKEEKVKTDRQNNTQIVELEPEEGMILWGKSWFGDKDKVKEITEVKLEGSIGEKVYSSEDILTKFQKDKSKQEFTIGYK